jgi:2-polyprenyl-6-methoxyphenol hydroxylase-like FAD-dependent oxidoreductase
MAQKPYDAIVIGARCAGAPLAMLLARKGRRVLVVDRASFPSDTVSTHLIHPPGVSALARWGLLERIVATGCPAIDTYFFDFGAFSLSGSPGTKDSPVAYAPRRTVLDKILVDAAAEAGAEIREGFSVEDVLVEEGRVAGIRGRARGGVTERAALVVGADGIHSVVAKSVRPETYNEKPPLNACYYSYWSGLPMEGRFEAYTPANRGLAVWPTNDGRTLVIAGWPYAEAEANKRDIEGNYMKVLEAVPSFAARIRGARREERFAGASVPNYFRKPFGPGWVLVGDAGYNKDFVTAQGIQDAFADAERFADAIDDALSGARSFEEAMAGAQAERDAHAGPMYEFTAALATFAPPPPELEKLLAAVAGNPEQMDGFARVNAGVTSPAEFFSEENVGRIFAATGRA